MRLIQMLTAGCRTSLRRLGLMAALAGGTNAGVLAVINSAAEHVQEDGVQVVSILMFTLVILAYLYSQRYVLVVTAEEVERIVHHRRLELIELLRACELEQIEKIGRGRLFTAINTDTQTISQSANGLVLGVQAVILIVCTSLYLATLSVTSLGVTAVFMLVASRMYMRKMQSVNHVLHRATVEENTLHDLVTGLLDGFKEVKLSSRRASGVLADVVAVSERTAEFRTEAQRALAVNFIFAQVSFFLLLATLVYLLPMLGDEYSQTIMKSLTVVMFLIGPISGIISTVPQVAIANAAAENLHDLGETLSAQLREPGAKDAGRAVPTALPPFRTLELRRAFFSHDAGEGSGFSVGPMDLTIQRGEIVFITGGNGSGKSTLIKLLTALYPPLSGELLLDGIPITSRTAQRYRDEFCAVFSDFYLFKRLYGITQPAPERADGLLHTMEIADKARISGDEFSTVDLSSGQRKRLALISAILEDKSIIVLDEWAADQDPHFRRKFYDELLPAWKAEGKTIIAVTHDDRYFHVADRRLHMEEGQLTELVSDHSDATRANDSTEGNSHG